MLGWAAYALTEVRKYLIPDSNDEIRQEQMREMELIRQVLLEQKRFTKGLSHKILSRYLRDTMGSKNITTSRVESNKEAPSIARLQATAGIGNKRWDASK